MAKYHGEDWTPPGFILRRQVPSVENIIAITSIKDG